MYFILKNKNHIKGYKIGDTVIFNNSDYGIHGELFIFSTRAPLTLLNEKTNNLFVLKSNNTLLEYKDFNLYKLYQTVHQYYVIKDIEYFDLNELLTYDYWSEIMKELFKKNIKTPIKTYILEPI